MSPLTARSLRPVLISIFCGWAALPQLIFANTGGARVSVGIENPLQFDNFVDFLTGILNIIIVLSVPIIIFFIIYAGFLYVTARGNAEQVKKATTALTYAVIGGVIIIGSVAIATMVGELVKEFMRQ